MHGEARLLLKRQRHARFLDEHRTLPVCQRRVAADRFHVEAVGGVDEQAEDVVVRAQLAYLAEAAIRMPDLEKARRRPEADVRAVLEEGPDDGVVVFLGVREVLNDRRQTRPDVRELFAAEVGSRAGF